MYVGLHFKKNVEGPGYLCGWDNDNMNALRITTGETERRRERNPLEGPKKRRSKVGGKIKGRTLSERKDNLGRKQSRMDRFTVHVIRTWTWTGRPEETTRRTRNK